MPTLAYKQTRFIQNRANTYKCDEIYKVADNRSIKQFGEYRSRRLLHIPGLWTLFSFIPFTPQQEQRIAFAEEVKKYQKALQLSNFPQKPVYN